MQRRTAGFSGIEILIVLVIVGILTGMAIPAFGRAQARRGAMNARDALVTLGARARSIAIEMGTTVELRLDPSANRAWIVDGTTTLEALDYTGEFAADVTAARSSGTLRVCYTPRGLGGACASSTVLPDTVTFARGPFTARAEVQFLGHVSRL